jgi:hypothetical protein
MVLKGFYGQVNEGTALAPAEFIKIIVIHILALEAGFLINSPKNIYFNKVSPYL